MKGIFYKNHIKYRTFLFTFITLLLILPSISSSEESKSESDVNIVSQHKSPMSRKNTLTTEPFESASVRFRNKLTDEEIIWLNHHPTIDIGVDGNWPPIDFMDNQNEHSGIADDFLDSIAKLLNIQFNVVPGPTFNAMLGKVRKGQLKLAASVVETPERANDLWFSSSFFTVQKVIIAKKNSVPYRTPEALFGKKVAIENGFSTMKQLQKLYPHILLKPVQSTTQALKEVSWGNADAYIGNGAVAQWIMQEQQISNIEFTGDPGLGPAPQRFAIHKDEQWRPLVGILNKALAQIDTRQRNKIYQQWLGVPDLGQTISTRLQLTVDEQKWLREHPDVRLGIDPSWPPIEFTDNTGRYQGLSAEYIKVIANSLNLNITPEKKLTWEQVINKAEKQQLDMIPALVKSRERSFFLNFTKPYLNFPFVIFVRDTETFITGLSDLHGKNVAVEKAYVTQEYLQRDHPDIDLMVVESSKEGLDKVSLGQVDAYVGNLTVGSYLITKYGISNIKIGGTTPYQYDLRIGVRKDWPELVLILDKFLDTLTAEEKSQIRQKWLAIKYDVEVDDAIVHNTIFVASILLLMSLIWILYTKRKHSQLMHSEEQLNLIIKTIPLAIVLTDNEGFIIKANPHVEKEIQSGDRPIVGRNMGDFYIEQKERDSVVQTLKQQGVVDEMEVHFRTDKGAVVTGLFSAVPIRIGKQLINLCLFVNLTQRIQMEEALKKAKKSSEQASQFKSNFLANMSHEIRTPMNAIIGMTHLALQTNLNNKQFDYIDKIKSSALNLLGIINDILDFSKIEAGKLAIEKTNFQLNDVLENLSSMMNLKAKEKNLDILFNRDPDIPNTLIGDPLRLGQVLINLVQNAIKFTDEGEIVVSVTGINTNEKTILIHFFVCDSGIGIDPERVQHLFDPFVQADSSISRKHGGTGLGLSISHQIVELMGGQLAVNSVPGRGSVFSFSLTFETQKNVDQNVYTKTPISETAFPGEKNEQHDRKSIDLFARQLQGNVLLAEDNLINQQVARELLQGFGLSVVIANNGQEAIDALHKKSFDLLLMDVQMPEMDGIKATKIIRSEQRFELLPIIAMTAHAMEGDREVCIDSGMNGYLSKPIEPEKLLKTLMAWLGEGTIKTVVTPLSKGSDVIELPETLAGIDLPWGLKRVGDNKELFVKLLKDFHRHHAGCCKKLHSFIENNRIDDACRLVHTIHGVAGNLGACDLQLAAQKVESSIKTFNEAVDINKDKSNIKNVPQWELLMNDFCQNAKVVFDSLSEFVPQSEIKRKLNDNSKNEKNSLSELLNKIPNALSKEKNSELLDLIKKLETLLLEGDTEACSTMGLLQNLIISNGQDDAIQYSQLLSQQVNDYEHDDALETLKALAHSLL